jgi:hypothetical protein
LGTLPPSTPLKFHKIGEKLIPLTPAEMSESTVAKGLLPYCFKVPTLEQSLGLLNGLCKFEDPLLRLQGTLKDWLLKLWVPPKPTVHSPKEWSVTLCLQVAKALLEAQVGRIQPTKNDALHRFVWHWEHQQCKPLPWLKALWPADVAWQPWQQPIKSLSSLSANQSSTLNRFFNAHALSPTWLAGAMAGSLSTEVALWGALWEQQTLPWYAILNGVEVDQKVSLLVKFPYLNRLLEAYQAHPHPNPLPIGEGANNNQKNIRKIVLVEGQSERCLLPALATALEKVRPFKSVLPCLLG